MNFTRSNWPIVINYHHNNYPCPTVILYYIYNTTIGCSILCSIPRIISCHCTYIHVYVGLYYEYCNSKSTRRVWFYYYRWIYIWSEIICPLPSFGFTINNYCTTMMSVKIMRVILILSPTHFRNATVMRFIQCSYNTCTHTWTWSLHIVWNLIRYHRLSQISNTLKTILPTF